MRDLLDYLSFSQYLYALDGFVSAHWLQDDGVLCVEFVGTAGDSETRFYHLEEVDP